MTASSSSSTTAASPPPDSSDHLIVLVHGLWGNPTHLTYLRSSLHAHLPSAHLLVCHSNSGYWTYDGIETGGERVTREIEDEISANGAIKRISVVGYSLGGLIARYAVGLLFSRGVFERVRPVNFTTFATPHLGVMKSGSLLGHAFNFIGARTVSRSGRQMFLQDKFRETGKPLVVVMAEPTSVFGKGLAAFEQRVVYANAVNDRTVAYFTASISSEDPFADLEDSGLKQNYLPGYGPNVLDYAHPLRARQHTQKASKSEFQSLLKNKFRRTIRMAPFVVIVGCLFPVALLVYLGMATIQTIHSRKRIKLHLEGKESELYQYYQKLPIYLAEEMQEAVEDVLELGGEVVRPSPLEKAVDSSAESSANSSKVDLNTPLAPTKSREGLKAHDSFPKLPLEPVQEKMRADLDSLGWRRFPVWIHGENHSHASIVVRQGPEWGAGEGKVVVKHWLKEVFVA